MCFPVMGRFFESPHFFIGSFMNFPGLQVFKPAKGIEEMHLLQVTNIIILYDNTVFLKNTSNKRKQSLCIRNFTARIILRYK